MKYFIDQEFHERMYKPMFGKEHHIIELISIGIVSEDGRSYYAICNEFDLDAAWNNKWLRENVLDAIHTEMCQKQPPYAKTYFYHLFDKFTKKSMKLLLKWSGKSKKQIAEEVTLFCSGVKHPSSQIYQYHTPEFYGYYADYDWVLFCSLFGTMMNLPKGFPMYCNDLKQTLDEYVNGLDDIKYTQLLVNGTNWQATAPVDKVFSVKKWDFETKLELVKSNPSYPKQENEHNALADANWNKKLYEFLQSIQ